MAPPPCRPRPTTITLPALMEELIEEILLRIAPDEPADLVRATLVCKPWRRILTGAGFLRRYRAFHGAPPPLLGYLHNLGHNNRDGIPTLAPTSTASASPPLPTILPEPDLELSNWVLDCRHGRVLIHALKPYSLVVWDPITGGRENLSLPGHDHRELAGAVLCAVDGCDHLDCHDGPFHVVFAGSGDDSGNVLDTWVAIYSSETGLWSDPISVHDHCVLKSKPPLLIRDTLYFSAEHKIILKCDFGAQELSLLEAPVGFSQEDILMEVGGGGLGFVSMEGNCLHRLLWRGDANSSTVGWIQDMVLELKTLLPTDNPFCHHDVVGWLEGTNTVFISVSSVGLFTLDLKSRKVKRVGERGNYYVVLPYTSFYTPDLANGTHHHLREDAKVELLP